MREKKDESTLGDVLAAYENADNFRVKYGRITATNAM